MFSLFDPVFRNLISAYATSDREAERARLRAEGADFIEYEGALPADFDMLAVTENEDGLSFVVREPLPDACRLADTEFDRPAVVPEIPELPAGAVVIPAVGAALPSGLTTIVVRAPYHLDHHFRAYVETDDDRRAGLIAHAAARRDALIEGGVMFRGHRIASDNHCAMKVLRAMEAARRDPAWSTVWECADGSALPLAGEDIGELHDAIEANHDDAFARYTRTKASIVAGTITTTDEADAAMAAGA
ncbi:DUF4376 domain-containing protein [Methylobacterium brachythecii]|uniref:DUF4376 domain-containing protein n=1 Tax=Methylobacterium brachythecii TaxID=1176177 RepID=A0A7W6AN88_9HYPH|nr:DUF4376 domain-containing protein [Methylobacterium brachythecii]MBB3904170.1 hypothetical protein [Methylobacterium brachythecii]GLS45168.1 hypothetical protein GCM10007884_31570 [Methylobacterium brachythecii]